MKWLDICSINRDKLRLQNPSYMASTSQVIRFGVFEANLQTGELRKSGIRIRLQEQPFTVLVMLLERPGQIVTREALSQKLWKGEFVEEEQGIARAINKVRQALGDVAENPRFIETLPRRGYRFIAPVHSADGKNGESGDKAARSLAILPLVNAASVPEIEHLCDGVTESLIYSCAQLAGLRVMASTTVFRFKDSGRDPLTIGKELNVEAVFTGRVRQLGDSLAVNVELVDVEDGSILWGGKYGRSFSEIFSLQEEIATEIFSKLRIRLNREDLGRLSRRPTSSLEAYNMYLQGRFELNRRTTDGLRKGLESYQRAIAMDPDYALAYAGIADYYAIASIFPQSMIPPKDGMPRARDMASKALQIDPDLAEAHTSLGVVSFYYDWDSAAAEKHFKNAIALKPGYPTSHQFYSLLLGALGCYEEAAVEAYKAYELDPLSPGIVRCLTAVPFYLGRKFERAAELLREVVVADPQLFFGRLFLGYCLCALGQLKDAAAELEMASRVSAESDTSLSRLGFCYGLADRIDDAKSILRRLEQASKSRYVAPIQFVYLHLGLGEINEAFQYLEKCFQEKSDYLVYLVQQPLFDSLRDDRRFGDLIRRVKLLEERNLSAAAR